MVSHFLRLTSVSNSAKSGPIAAGLPPSLPPFPIPRRPAAGSSLVAQSSEDLYLRLWDVRTDALACAAALPALEYHAVRRGKGTKGGGLNSTASIEPVDFRKNIPYSPPPSP